MNGPFKTITGVSLAGMFALFALHGTAFFNSLEIAFNFLFAISAKAPLGVGSFALALLMAMFVWLALQKWIPDTRNRWSKSTLIDVLTVGVGAYVAYMQLPNSNGLLFGFLAGFAAPHPARWSMALATWVGHKFTDAVAAKTAADEGDKQ